MRITFSGDGYESNRHFCKRQNEGISGKPEAFVLAVRAGYGA